MKLTTKARYAVMAMVDLTATSDGRPVCLATISERQNISLSYLEQLFRRLRCAGLVSSVRGPGGGYLLAGNGARTAIAEIVHAVDEPIRATRCPDPGGDAKRGCLGDGHRCMTHDLWESLGDQINQFLAGVTLADVVAGALPCAAERSRRLTLLDLESGALSLDDRANHLSGL